ncbi:uncharacterized protein BO96DRAFT_35696 [Aspergillus niger CBS 101883]|uniref:uncharacterized protein n=1 Tax=Aspergillus lacticoffeatus (strain CBS 101883) TaxID=1450533 RepID=UPI000D7F685E|nr:uncharacterized protein BO96DRAFT_35696 [Aspergillus niger CBS 101883]PYH57293.1 hypothetical protein BO96DRAFT_35696 [Aspergillus niger CBS 101883]
MSPSGVLRCNRPSSRKARLPQVQSNWELIISVRYVCSSQCATRRRCLKKECVFFIPLVSSGWLLSLFFLFPLLVYLLRCLCRVSLLFLSFLFLSFFFFFFFLPLVHTLSGLLSPPLPSLLGRSKISSARRSRLITLFSCIFFFFFFRVLLFTLQSSHLSKITHREYQILRETQRALGPNRTSLPQLAFSHASPSIAIIRQWRVLSVYCLDLTTL